MNPEPSECAVCGVEIVWMEVAESGGWWVHVETKQDLTHEATFSGQMTLADPPPREEPTDTIQARFEEFHRKHPEVYRRIWSLTQGLHNRGLTKGSMKMIFEVIRWERIMDEDGESVQPFKLSNDFTSRYARRIMEDYPEWDGFFSVKELKAP